MADSTGSKKSAPLRKRTRELDTKVTPQLEVENVQQVYDSIASHWHGTRYKAWPKVEAFIKSKPAGTFFADVGCGNGKNMPACNEIGSSIGSDISSELVKIALERKLEVSVSDIMNLPYRTGVFDAVLCIAVLHHISTKDRRVQAIRECMRVVKVGGEALFYAWAMEQSLKDGSSTQEGKSGHRFEEPDVLVPYHLKAERLSGADREALDSEKVQFDETKKAYVFQRYCHVYKQGELESLAESLGPAVEVVQVYWDTGNWAMILKKKTS